MRHTRSLSLFASALCAALLGCHQVPTDASADLNPVVDVSVDDGVILIPGKGTNKVALLSPYSALTSVYGQGVCVPDPSCKTPQGFGLVTFPRVGLSAYLGTDGDVIDDKAVVLAMWTQDASIKGPVSVGTTPAEMQAALGPPDNDYGTVQAYGKGLSVSVDKSGKIATVAVFAPYTSQKTPPEMLQAEDAPQVTPQAGTWPRYQLDGEEIDVVDMHLHPGSFGALGAGIANTLVANVPPFLLPILPAFTNTVSNPYTPGVGMVAQARRFGFAHIGLLAVWAPATVGWYSNTDLSTLLYDARNLQRPDGKPLAFGFASIYWSDLMNNTLVAQRCAALESFLMKQGDRIIGIKLAHPHQGVPLASVATDCVYTLAGRYKKPLAMHTGKTPTPGSLDTAEAYDPKFLEDKIKRFPGATFILMHVGQGDLRATNSALTLAQNYANVALELSALGRPTVLNERGEIAMTMEPQFINVLAEAKKRNLSDKLIWASDGPQSPGFAASYRDRIVAELKNQAYSKDQIKAILAGNFYRIFGMR